jgi:hypothetical protein
MMLRFGMSTPAFNAAVREGTAAQTISRILEETKPEAAYFTAEDGRRTAILFVEVAEPSRIPTLAEPWFLHFDADFDMAVAMTPEDLGKAGLEDLARRWT